MPVRAHDTMRVEDQFCFPEASLLRQNVTFSIPTGEARAALLGLSRRFRSSQ